MSTEDNDELIRSQVVGTDNPLWSTPHCRRCERPVPWTRMEEPCPAAPGMVESHYAMAPPRYRQPGWSWHQVDCPRRRPMLHGQRLAPTRCACALRGVDEVPTVHTSRTGAIVLPPGIIEPPGLGVVFDRNTSAMKGWEVHQAVLGDGQPTWPRTVRELGGQEDWPSGEVTDGVAHVSVEIHGDDPDGAFVRAVGPDRAKVEAAFERAAASVRYGIPSGWMTGPLSNPDGVAAYGYDRGVRAGRSEVQIDVEAETSKAFDAGFITGRASAMRAALDQVLQYHRPTTKEGDDGATMEVCQECGFESEDDRLIYRPWPCPTYQAMAAAMLELDRRPEPKEPDSTTPCFCVPGGTEGHYCGEGNCGCPKLHVPVWPGSDSELQGVAD